MRILLLLGALALSLHAEQYIRYQQPPLLNWDELREIGEKEPMPRPLSDKVDKLITTPFVSNEAWYDGAKPIRPDLRLLGPGLRVLLWNIERGLRLDDLVNLFTDKKTFMEKADAKNVTALLDLADQVDFIRQADVLILNELDWGMKRTAYREVVRELGRALNMNWAFAVEFLEVDPVNLGTEPFQDAEAAESKKLQEMLAVDKDRYRGLHGTAVLSRYPIRSAKAIPLRIQAYDWYFGEQERVSKLEKGKRAVADKVFLETILREIRRGGRTTLLVTLDVPDLPEKQLTIAAPHLENRCKPDKRRLQMGEVLRHLEKIDHPVILAGDLNTSLTDAKPTSLKREIYKRVGSAEFWAQRGLKWATGVGLAYDVVTTGVTKVKNLNDPTARHVPIVAPNPEAKLFELLQEFRFDDRGAFDFRGDTRRSPGREGTLANSNQRAEKGFEVTYKVTRNIGPFGQFKLDWIFVKPYPGRAPSPGAPYRFSPHFPRTLDQLNYSYEEPLSDHNPMTVDLPFGEPSLP
jgi:endonuclease/exonuclease/phosphatase family metal-dependent hydrolase